MADFTEMIMEDDARLATGRVYPVARGIGSSHEGHQPSPGTSQTHFVDAPAVPGSATISARTTTLPSTSLFMFPPAPDAEITPGQVMTITYGAERRHLVGVRHSSLKLSEGQAEAMSL